MKLTGVAFGDETPPTTWWSARDFYDAARDEACSVLDWSDGAHYCTPDAAEAVYVTPDCSTALGRVVAASTPPPYFVREFSIHGIALPSHLHRAGDPASPPSLAWELRDGGCTGVGEPLPGFDYYALGDEIAKAGLVRVLHSTPEGTGRLRLVSATSADGLAVPLTFFDEDRAEPCTPLQRPNAATTECVPASARPASYFHDAACTQIAIAAPLDALPAVISSTDPLTRCTGYFTLGQEITGDPLFEHAGAACIPSSTPGGTRQFLAGAAVELGALERARETEPGRRVQRVVLRAAGRQLQDGPVFDTTHATECTSSTTERCLPVLRAAEVGYFADDQCQQALPLARVPAGGCDPPSAFATNGDTTYPVGALYTGPVYEVSTGDICAPYAPPASFELHLVGEGIPLTAFARAVPTVDR